MEYNHVFDILKVLRLERFLESLILIDSLAIFNNLVFLPLGIIKTTFYFIVKKIINSNIPKG